MESTRSYPLYWPEGWPRSKYQKQAKFGDHSVAQGRKILQDQVRLFGGSELIISSNLELKLDGMPKSNQRQPGDRGVAIFFKHNKQDFALACDVYTTVEDNLWALCRTLAALRQIERDGSPSLINRAFKGFAALPDPSERKWHEVLGVPSTATEAEIRQAYFILAKKYHPDNKETGNPDRFLQVQQAYEAAMGVRSNAPQ